MGTKPLFYCPVAIVCAVLFWVTVSASAEIPLQTSPEQTIKQKPASAPAKVTTTPSIWPVTGSVTSGFGWRISPFGDGNELHAGIDIASPAGTPVVATADGQVILSGSFGGYGNAIQIDHGSGITTIYGHNSELAVGVGHMVKKGQIIAYVGSTGKSTGPHVHYEVRVNDTAVDPWKYLLAF